MAEFLSPEWLAAARDAAPAPGVDLSLQVTVTGAPGGDVQWHAVCRGGALTELAAGALPDADVALTLPYAEAVAVQKGELDPSVAYMQGRMKTAGDPGKLLVLLAATATSAYAALRTDLAAVTDL
jgi:hypothetical protein